MSSSKHMSNTKSVDEEYASKKKRLRPHPDEEDKKSASNSKKLNTGSSMSKGKLSTQKKCEVTFSEDIEQFSQGDAQGKENKEPFQVTPLKMTSPSKMSLKSVKEHVKTPFSKVKENQDHLMNSSKSKAANQPNFEGDYASQNGKSSGRNSREVTPPKTTTANRSFSKSKVMSKSPLSKIREEKVECELPNTDSNEANKQNGECNNEENPIVTIPEPVTSEVNGLTENQNSNSNSNENPIKNPEGNLIENPPQEEASPIPEEAPKQEEVASSEVIDNPPLEEKVEAPIEEDKPIDSTEPVVEPTSNIEN